MRYVVDGPWPCGTLVIPSGTIIDANSGDGFSQAALGKVPPPHSIPLDNAARDLLNSAYVYDASGYAMTRNGFGLKPDG